LRFWFVALAGCPEGPQQPPSPPCPVELLVGDGQQPFRAREDGDVAPIIHGPQGGFHLDVSLRATGLPSPWEVELLAVEPGGVVVSEQHLSIAPAPVDRCTADLEHTIALLDVHELSDDDPGEVLAGQTLTLEATVTGADGSQATASVEVLCAAPSE
jgi:hypothetical protein